MNNIGLMKLKVVKEVSLFEAQFTRNLICAGRYEDKIILVYPEKLFDLLDEKVSPLEQVIVKTFPQSEVVILGLNSTVSLYGFSIINNGERQRIKCGADGDVYVDFGKELPEEAAIKKEQIFGVEETKEMQEGYDDEMIKKIIDNEVGIRVTSRLLQRFFGEEVGTAFNKIRLIEYAHE